ncbi:MAG: hypothetical protein U0529_15335 [Thermoanaerobaculia bacterium]
MLTFEVPEDAVSLPLPAQPAGTHEGGDEEGRCKAVSPLAASEVEVGEERSTANEREHLHEPVGGKGMGRERRGVLGAEEGTGAGDFADHLDGHDATPGLLVPHDGPGVREASKRVENTALAHAEHPAEVVKRHGAPTPERECPRSEQREGGVGTDFPGRNEERPQIDSEK